MNKRPRLLAFLCLGTALGIVLACLAPEPRRQEGFDPQSIEWLATPGSLLTFNLESDQGPFNNQSFTGHWTIVMFGFLHCPDICPTSLSQLATVAESISKNSIHKEVKYIFVSVDPDRDSATEVSQYARQFQASILGVTGTTGQLHQLADSLGIEFKVSNNDNNYRVAHSVTFSIIGPQGMLRGRFRPGFDAKDLVRNLIAKIEST